MAIDPNARGSSCRAVARSAQVWTADHLGTTWYYASRSQTAGTYNKVQQAQTPRVYCVRTRKLSELFGVPPNSSGAEGTWFRLLRGDFGT